jgi:hypothetical protein
MTLRVPLSYAHAQALSVVASFSKFTVVEDAFVAAPTAGDASGLAAASRAAVSLNSNKAIAKQLLCDGVDEFVALADSIFDGADPAPPLARLQTQLDGASYLLNNSLTLADVVVFLALHPTIQSQSGSDDLVDVVRWAIQIQADIASSLPPITPHSLSLGALSSRRSRSRRRRRRRGPQLPRLRKGKKPPLRRLNPRTNSPSSTSASRKS